MQTEDQSLQRLKTEIEFKRICDAQGREAEYAAAEIIYELFEPYLEELQVHISKDGYELVMQAWIEERSTEILPALTTPSSAVIVMIFHWEPIEDEMRYQEAQFTSRQAEVLKLTLSRFVAAIGYAVRIENTN